MDKLKVILIGAGGRGIGYTNIMDSERFEVVAVAEPIDVRRNYVKERHNIPDEMCFTTWEPLLDLPKMADVAIISTQDRMHRDPAIKAIELGYNLLLEKPVAPTPQECVEVLEAARKHDVKILVCHVLRYSPFFMKLKEIVDSGMIGDIISIEHDECVGNIHQSHSFVRGNWGNSDKSSSMILQKTCHDMDILQWIIGKKCKSVQSFGSLSYFVEKNAPEGAPDYCIDGCPEADKCCYNAVKIYLQAPKEEEWYRKAATEHPSPSDADVEKALRTTQYGKCVYKCDNNVVDHQVVNLEFEGGETVSFTMCAFTEGGRHIRVMGTKGELTGNMADDSFNVYLFADRSHKTITASEIAIGETIADGHGGGDDGIIEALYGYMVEGKTDIRLSEIGISVENHIISFAAEKSRVENRVINIEEFEKEVNLI